MKCSKCGAELAPGARFCRECGAKVEAEKRFCRECGAELCSDAKFCSKCGAKVLDLSNVETEKEAGNAKARETQDASECSCSDSTANAATTPTVASNAEEEKSSTLGARAKKSILAKWRKLDLFCKLIAISSIVIFILTVVAVCTGKVLPIVLSVLQIAAIVMAILIHKGVIKLEQKSSWLMWLILAAAILLTALNIMSYSWKSTAPATGQSPSSTNQNSGDTAEKIDWKNITLSKVLPEPQSNMMEILYNGEDWLNVTVYDISKNDFLEYVRWCKEDYGFSVDSDSFDDYFYAHNQDGYCLTLLYDETSNELSIDLNPPAKNITETLETDKRAEKDGFNTGNNEVYNLAGYTIEIPSYWKSEQEIADGIQRYAETGGKVAMLQISAQAESDKSYPVTFDGLMDDNDNMIKTIESTAFSEVTDYEVIDTGVIKGILYKGTIKDKDSGLSGYGEWFVFPSEEDRSWCTLIMSQTDNTDYLYTGDFRKMIQSIKVNENEPENPTASEAKPSEIALTMGAEDFKGMNYKEAEEIFRRMGFAKFEYRTVDTETESFEDTICYIEITEWFVGDSHFAKGDKFDADSTVTFFSYKYEAPSPISYSTNDLETAKKGNTGVFSYKSKGGSYDSYWIIDFDEGYVYWFTDGNGDTTCDRLSIDSGTLNDVVVVTYHDGDSSWSYGLHFKWQNQPDHLIVQDNDGFMYDYYSTNLSSALTLKAAKTIYDY